MSTPFPSHSSSGVHCCLLQEGQKSLSACCLLPVPIQCILHLGATANSWKHELFFKLWVCVLQTLVPRVKSTRLCSPLVVRALGHHLPTRLGDGLLCTLVYYLWPGPCFNSSCPYFHVYLLLSVQDDRKEITIFLWLVSVSWFCPLSAV